jgi:hypothetical protein
MTLSLNSLDDYLQVLGFPFRERQAVKKIAIGGLLSLLTFVIPIIPMLILSGYAARIMKRILRDGDPYLPEWDNWNELLSDGLRVWGASMLISLPVLIPMWASLFFMFLSWFVLPALASSNIIASDTATTLVISFSIFGLLGFGLALLISPLVALAQSAAIGHVVAHDSFQAMFRVREWWEILRAGLGVFVMEWAVVLVLSVLGSIAISASWILCFLYPVLLALYPFLIVLYSYTFIALAYREARRRLLARAAHME